MNFTKDTKLETDGQDAFRETENISNNETQDESQYINQSDHEPTTDDSWFLNWMSQDIIKICIDDKEHQSFIQ